MTQAVQTRAAPTNAPGDRRPDENLHKLSDELSKQADEGTLGKK